MPKGTSDLVPTPLDDIPKIVEAARKRFKSGVTKSLSWRKDQLRHMFDMLEENKEAICEAMMKDLGKNKYDSSLTEVLFVQNEIVDAITNLDSWAKPEPLKQSFPYSMETVVRVSEPYGAILNISPFNYPFHLLFAINVGAIAAGNVVVSKPSELTWNVAQLIATMQPQYLDPEAFPVILGGIPETSKLLEEKWDHIVYTGNGMVGRIVASAAAKHLTPTTLELGGKSPVYVDKASDMWLAARRISLGKWSNAGQTCVAPDYVMVEKSAMSAFIDQMKAILKEYYGDNAQSSPDYSRIINLHHTRRLAKMLDAQKAAGTELLVGGTVIEDDLYIEPTIFKFDKLDGETPVMQGEIFGPILPVFAVDGVDEAIDYVKQGDHPLAAYCFSTDRVVINKWISDVHSGGMCINDTVTHLAVKAPFGGVGESGSGAYHSKYGFDNFSHKKTVMDRPQSTFGEKMNEIRSPPWSEKKFSWLTWLAGKRVNWSAKTPRGSSV